MTVITNMVVALMIVTQGEEPVQAYPQIEIKRPAQYDVMLVSNPIFETLYRDCVVVGPSDRPETLYRKTCKTNFVYSANIDVGKIHGPCKSIGCDGRKQFTIDELFKCPIRGIYFETPIGLYCDKHECLNYLAR